MGLQCVGFGTYNVDYMKINLFTRTYFDNTTESYSRIKVCL